MPQAPFRECEPIIATRIDDGFVFALLLRLIGTYLESVPYLNEDFAIPGSHVRAKFLFVGEWSSLIRVHLSVW